MNSMKSFVLASSRCTHFCCLVVRAGIGVCCLSELSSILVHGPPAFFIHSLGDGRRPGPWREMGAYTFMDKSSCGCAFSFLLSRFLGVELLGVIIRLMFNILRNFPTIFQRGCSTLCFHRECVGIPFTPHPCQHVMLFAVFIRAIPPNDGGGS